MPKGSEIDIVVRLVDQVSAAAGKVSTAINKLTGGARKAGQAGETITKGAEKGAKSLDKLAKASDRAAKSATPIATKANAAAKGVDKFARSTDKAARSAGNFGKVMGGVGKNLTSAGAAMTAVGAALTAAVVGPIKVAADFEHAMSAVQAVSGATADEFDALTQKALELGSTTKFTAREVAAAQRFMAMAGLEAAEILGALPTVLDLAAAGNIELGTSADIVTNILAGYGLAVEDLTHASDVLVAAFTTTNTSLQELGDGMKFVAPVASALNVRFEETVAALGLLSNAGLKGTLAGTSLRGALTLLLNPAKEDAALLKQLGIITKDTAGNFVGFANIVDQFNASGAKANQVLDILGQRAGPGLQALISVGAEAIRQLEEHFKNVDGIAKIIATTMEDNVSGAFTRLTSAAEGFAIAVGSPLLQVTQKFLDILAVGVRAAQDFFVALGPIAPVIVLVVGALGTLTLGLGAAALAWSLFGSGIKSILEITLRLAAAIFTRFIPALAAETAAVGTAAAAQEGLAGAIQLVNLARLAWVAGIGAVIAGLAVLTSAVIHSVRERRKEIDALAESKRELQELEGTYQDVTDTLSLMGEEGERATDLNGVALAKLAGATRNAKKELALMVAVRKDELAVIERAQEFGFGEAELFDTEDINRANQLRTEITELEKKMADLDDTVKELDLEKALDPKQAVARLDIIINQINVVGARARELPAAFEKLGEEIQKGLAGVLPQFDIELETLLADAKRLGEELREVTSLKGTTLFDEAEFKRLTVEWKKTNDEIKRVTESRDQFISDSINRYKQTFQAALQSNEDNYQSLEKAAKKAFTGILRDNRATVEQQRQATTELAAIYTAEYRRISGAVTGALGGIRGAIAEVNRMQDGLAKAQALNALKTTLVSTAKAGKEAFSTLATSVESALDRIARKEEDLRKKIEGIEKNIKGVREEAAAARLKIDRESLTGVDLYKSKVKEAEGLIRKIRTASWEGNTEDADRYGRQVLSIAADISAADEKGFVAMSRRQKAIKLINEQEKLRIRALDIQKQKQTEQLDTMTKLREQLEKTNTELGGIIEKLGKDIKVGVDTEKLKEDLDNARAEIEGKPIKVTVDSEEAETKLDTAKEKIEKLTDKEVLIQALTAQAKANVDAVFAAINRLKSKTVTITTVHRTVQASKEGGPVMQLLKFAMGGKLPGYGGGDKIPVLAEAGEWVIRKEAVREYGHGLMSAINNMRLRLQDVKVPTQRLQEGGPVGPTSAETLEVRFNTGDESFPVRVQGREDMDMVKSLARRLNRQRLVTS